MKTPDKIKKGPEWIRVVINARPFVVRKSLEKEEIVKLLASQIVLAEEELESVKRELEKELELERSAKKGTLVFTSGSDITWEIERMPRWISVEERLPESAGLYLVAYHPCWWDDVDINRCEVGIDTFRGKTTWAKKKFQRVTHWMRLPEPPKEE